MRWGNFSAYYFFDDYHLNNPFPSGQGGATVPGFGGLNYGRAQLISLGDTKTFGTNTVNEAHFSFMRSRNVVGQPAGGLELAWPPRVSLIRRGNGGHLRLGSRNRRGRKRSLPGRLCDGVPITNVDQANNTFFAERKPLQSHRQLIRSKFGVDIEFRAGKRESRCDI